jgi:hypothetical protein
MFEAAKVLSKDCRATEEEELTEPLREQLLTVINCKISMTKSANPQTT